METTHESDVSVLNALPQTQTKILRQTGHYTPDQGERNAMTAACVVCGNPCRCEQWVAGGGAFACSLGCLEGRSS